MSIALSTIVTLSLVGLVGGVVSFEIRRGQFKGLLASAVLILIAIMVFGFITPAPVETKGTAEETVAVVFCYLAMLLGMIAEYFYSQGERGQNQFKFEPIKFMMPVFASPIVFIPLLTITNEMAIGGAFTKAKLMIYLVAFQNGFFWKGFFEQSRQKIEQSSGNRQTDALGQEERIHSVGSGEALRMEP